MKRAAPTRMELSSHLLCCTQGYSLPTQPMCFQWRISPRLQNNRHQDSNPIPEILRFDPLHSWIGGTCESRPCVGKLIIACTVHLKHSHYLWDRTLGGVRVAHHHCYASCLIHKADVPCNYCDGPLRELAMRTLRPGNGLGARAYCDVLLGMSVV